MKMIRSSFAALLAAIATIGWSVAFAFDNQIADVSVDRHNVISSPGANLLGLDTATADTGMPPPLIVISFASDSMGSDNFTAVGQNGHYRSSVAAAPPLITATSLDKALSSTASFGIDLAGTMTFDTSQHITDYWSGSGTQIAGTIAAVPIATPPEI